MQPHIWLNLTGRPTSYTFIINRILMLYSPTSFLFFHRQCSRDTLPGYGTTETKAQTCSRAPFNRFLFRLSPCVNLFYCLLLFNHPMGPIPTEDTAIIGIWPRQIKSHVPGNLGLIIGSRQPIFFYKDRIPSGVFGVTSLAVYASALNHVFRQMLGFRAPGFAA